MTEIQQRFLDNLPADMVLASALVAISAAGLYRFARFWKVSVVPFLTLLPSYLAVGLVLYVPVSPLYLRSDGEFYQSWGFSLANSWISGESADFSRSLWPGKGVWPLIIGGLAAVAGPVTISLIVFNTLILVLSVILLQKATFILGGRSPRWSMVIVFLSSSPFALWGPSLLREALFWLGIALGVLALAFASNHRWRSTVQAIGLSALVLLGIRPDAGFVLLYGFAIMLLILWGAVGRQRSLPRAATSSLILLLLAVSFPTGFSFVQEGEITAARIVAANESLAAEDVTTRFSYPDEPADPANPAGPSSEFECSDSSLVTVAICKSVRNLPFSLFGPFYWEYGPSAIWFIAGASTLHFLVLVSFAAYSVAAFNHRRWALLATLVVAGVSLLMFSSVMSNYGVLIRFRAATEIMLIPPALSGALLLMSRLRLPRKNRL